MRKQLYKGETIRRDNCGQTDMPAAGKYAAIVRCQEVRTFLADEPDEDGRQWCWVGVGGCTGGLYDSESEAFKRGIAFSKQAGFTEDEKTARRRAIDSLVKRHNSHCRRSGAYRKHYGPETSVAELAKPAGTA